MYDTSGETIIVQDDSYYHHFIPRVYWLYLIDIEYLLDYFLNKVNNEASNIRIVEVDVYFRDLTLVTSYM